MQLCKISVDYVDNFFHYPQGYRHYQTLVDTGIPSVLNFSTAPITNTTKIYYMKKMYKGARKRL